MTSILSKYGRSFSFIIMSIFLLLLPEAELQAQEGLYVHQIVMHPDKPGIIYASTDNHGMLKSNDRGETWRVANKGIKSYLLYQIAIHPERPEVLYVSSWGGGIYQ
ncbi:MAG: hypothetical protein U0940_02160, partial [Nitrospirota bacterium]|nr:hypothetical protein [Nitrospirota bacterium]